MSTTKEKKTRPLERPPARIPDRPTGSAGIYFELAEPTRAELGKRLDQIRAEQPGLALSKRQAMEIFLGRAFEALRRKP